MNAGYVRLSKDDDKKNYVSIENQKLIISQYAADHGIAIDRWYEDDGISGYVFDRPGFQQLMADLDHDIDTVYVKDFSRLGRHNAKVLLLLDEFQERGKHLVVIDDNYDSMEANDDMIGIKTWFNERYVKDTSKKIKCAIGAKQKEGTLMTRPPFGYRRDADNPTLFIINPTEAESIRFIYRLYLSGLGYRKIANYLNEQKLPTPSMRQREHEIENRQLTKRNIAFRWSDSMVRDLLGNDFYIGTLRLRKRARKTIHSKDCRIPKEEQYIFENHHPAIIDKTTFSLVQELKEKRSRTNYRGSLGQWADSEIPNPFSGCLFCKDCGSRLTPIKRQTSGRERKYYICTTYNTKGKRYCSKAHLIEEAKLMKDVLTYLQMCRNAFSEVISDYDLTDLKTEKKCIEEKRQELHTAINDRKNQLKILLTQKIKDLSPAAENKTSIHKENFIREAYDSMQADLCKQIHELEMQRKELEKAATETSDVAGSKNPLDIMDHMIAEGTLGHNDIELLIQKIIVDENGMPEITLKYGLSKFINNAPAKEMNRKENTIIAIIMKLISEDKRGYTSAKYLSEHLTDLGFSKTKQRILPYIELMKILDILEDTDNPRKPYRIMRSEKEISLLARNYLPDLSAEMTAKQISDDYLNGCAADRWRTYINVNYETIVILCNWVDGLNSAKNLVSTCT